MRRGKGHIGPERDLFRHLRSISLGRMFLQARCGTNTSDRLSHFFKADQASERTHLTLLILAKLKQQRHRG